MAADDRRVYAVARDGVLRTYDKTGGSLALTDTVTVSDHGVGTMTLAGGVLYVGKGQANVAVDARHVYLAGLNDGDEVQAFDAATLAPGARYGTAFEPGVTVAYDLTSGARLASFADPPTVTGAQGFPAVALAEGKPALTEPGCCGAGVYLLDADTLEQAEWVFVTYANALAESAAGLIVGTEGGDVDFVDRRPATWGSTQTVSLRAETGHTGSEDIEVRAVWYDGLDGLVFAASSWGNAASRGPDLPAFFVLELR